jgi:hypothetical protein
VNGSKSRAFGTSHTEPKAAAVRRPQSSAALRSKAALGIARCPALSRYDRTTRAGLRATGPTGTRGFHQRMPSRWGRSRAVGSWQLASPPKIRIFGPLSPSGAGYPTRANPPCRVQASVTDLENICILLRNRTLTPEPASPKPARTRLREIIGM